MTTAELQIRLFGGLDIVRGGAPVTGFMSSKAPALLAYLAVTGRPHSRDALAGLLWGDLPDVDAKNNLRQTLSNLRRLLEPHLLITREAVALNPAAPYTLDVEEFERLVADSLTQRPPAVDGLRSAVGLYRGDFLSGFFVRDAPAFDEWALPLRARYRELALQALHALTVFHTARAEHIPAIDYATRLLALDAWREEAHRQLMLALARSGQRSAALAQYEACRRILEKEMGVTPSAETTALYERIRAAGDTPRHNLPAPASPLIGRAGELSDIVARLLDSHCRLLTLIGLGGSGKTRLALAAGERLRDAFLNGVWLAPLANVDTGGTLPLALADALGFSPSGGNVDSELLDYLAEKEALLILDNFEHLAGDDSATRLLAAVLERAPDVKLLLTSRERLNLQSEWLHEIRPLGGDDAAEVFRHYAGRIAPAESLASEAAQPAVRRICASVGGLPLALALAAGWARAMSPSDIAAALERNMALLATSMRDAPERHRSMQAVFDHSWHLLPPEEMRALAALTVFRSGFTGEAARAVTGASPAVLSSLADKSWVQRASSHRFQLHELARQYAAGKLAGAQAVLDRHCAYFAEWMAVREPLIRTARQKQVIEELRAEVEDIRLMWQTAVRAGQAEVFDRTLHSMFWAMDVSGRHEEGVRLFGEAVNCLQGRPGSEAVRGRLLARQGALARLLSKYDEAQAMFIEAEAMSRTAGDASNQAYALRFLGFFLTVRGEVEAGLARMVESLRLYRAVGDLPRVADALISVGIVESRLGHFDRAGQLHREAADILNELGDEMGLAVALNNLGDVAGYRGQSAQALAHHRAAAEIQRRYDDRRDLAESLYNIAGLLIELKQWDEALAAAQEGADLFRERGSRDGLMNALEKAAGALLGRGEVEQALRYFNEAISIGMRLNAEADLLTVLVLGARLLQARGQIADAARLLVSIRRSPAAVAFAVKSAEAAMQELPAEAVARAEATAEVWTAQQMVDVMQREAAQAPAR